MKKFIGNSAMVVCIALLLNGMAHAVVPLRILKWTVQAADDTIASHTKVINSGRLQGSALVKRYWERGRHYVSLNQYALAITDFGSAIKLDRSFAQAYIDRALAYAKQENYKLAFNDLHMAGKIEPNNSHVYATRGAMYFLLGRYQQAQKDFLLYLQIKPRDMYRMLWLVLSEKYQDPSSKSVVASMVQGLDLNAWPGALLRLYLNQVTAEDLVKVLAGAEMKRGHKCEAYYYLGQYYLLQNDRINAKRLFQQAIATGATDYTEHQFAMAYLEKLERINP
ncbi:MAG: tetratricopeptide repeat protein [Gammaproteobacteria bacterium]|nr:tetratricopeptide repeat protein [Gammaproteobacteria bacterium]MDH5800978.1 tetratricopeptide repeat protein [Gammaproteobacteria bacterium]